MADKIRLSELNTGDIFTFERERYRVAVIGEEETEVILLESMLIRKDIEKPKERIWVGKKRLALNGDTLVRPVEEGKEPEEPTEPVTEPEELVEPTDEPKEPEEGGEPCTEQD